MFYANFLRTFEKSFSVLSQSSYNFIIKVDNYMYFLNANLGTWE